jgi:beta-carotene ketolase (CrtW type)
MTATALPANPPQAAAHRRPGRLLGVVLAFAVIGAFLAIHVGAVFFWRWDRPWSATAPLVAAVQCWLCVGLFITAHDAMHGSLAPGRPRLNGAIGRVCLLLYAGFNFNRLRTAHHAHHAAPGTADDPDFFAPAPTRLLVWYAGFIGRYFGWRQMAFMAAVYTVEGQLLGAERINQIVFWAVPALLSSLQLFVFGTWLPHRHEGEQDAAPHAGFADRHRARSLGYPWLGSLLACYHFNYHHEHHLMPHVPWWGLPAARRRLAAGSAPPSR